MAVNPGWSNLKPVKPGDPPRNPEGRNQWTYRREAIEHMRARAERDGKVIHDLAWDKAIEGDFNFFKLVWEDLHPKTEKREHSFPDGVPVNIDAEPERIDELQGILDEATER